jgi:hypothetical protein
MPKVSGIDFSALHHFRESAHIILLDGNEVELPLLPVKHATEGLSLLQRNDTLASRYAVLQTKLTLKAKALQKLKEDIGDDPDKLDELKQEEHLDTFDSVYKSMQTLQEQTAALCKESNALCEQIVEFLRPYLSADIIEQLSKVDDFCTVRVLELMLYGDEALNSDDEGSETAEENPSTTASL